MIGVGCGIRSTLLASLLGAASGACVFGAYIVDPQISVIAGTNIRIWMNALLVLGLALTGWRAFPSWQQAKSYLPWGICGALCVLSFYASVKQVGSGVASILNASFGIFAVLLGANSSESSRWLVAPAAVGLTLMLWGHPVVSSTGIVLGLLSGLFAGLAYYSVSRQEPAATPSIAMFFWTLVCLPVGVLWIVHTPAVWPHTAQTWSLLLAGGFFAAASQYFMADAYARGPLNAVSAAAYLLPILCLGADAAFFARRFSRAELLGISLIILSGLLGASSRQQSDLVPEHSH